MCGCLQHPHNYILLYINRLCLPFSKSHCMPLVCSDDQLAAAQISLMVRGSVWDFPAGGGEFLVFTLLGGVLVSHLSPIHQPISKRVLKASVFLHSTSRSN